MGLFNRNSKEMREFKRDFDAIIDDLLDHYNQYSTNDKETLRAVFSNLERVNAAIFDKYDADDKKKNNGFWSRFTDSFNRLFGEK